MENRYLSIDCTKTRNNSKRTKASRNEVIQPTTSNNHSRPIVSKPCPQAGRFVKPAINRRGFIYFGVSKMVFTF